MWKEGMFHGKGLFYIKARHLWQLSEFEEGTMTRVINAGEGKPSALSI